jgi:cephalosporin hydroxylase
MPLARTFDPASGKVVTTLHDALADRLSKWSDIQEYLPFLYEQARSRPGCRVLELGARRGNSTLAFLAGCTESGGHVWSCDIDDVRRFPDGIGPFAASPRWTFVHGSDMDPAVQARLPDQVDVWFLDTSHEYEHTLAELRAYMPRLAPGGVALFHDTNLNGWPGYRWDSATPPVAAALDEWCAETGAAWENMPGEYGLGVIRA